MTALTAFWLGIGVGAAAGAIGTVVGIFGALAVIGWMFLGPRRKRERISTNWWRGGR
jgi:hypothetical protein